MDTTAKEEVLLDENTDSKGHDFYMTHGVETSPDHKRIAYAVDTSGGEKYTLHVKELETGKELLRTPIKVVLASLLRFCLTVHSCLGQDQVPLLPQNGTTSHKQTFTTNVCKGASLMHIEPISVLCLS